MSDDTHFAHIAAMQYAYERSLVVVPRDAARMAEHSVALEEQVSKSWACRHVVVDTYTKPKLISPHTAAFVDSGILTFQTT